jgi:hypothetical protein
MSIYFYIFLYLTIGTLISLHFSKIVKEETKKEYSNNTWVKIVLFWPVVLITVIVMTVINLFIRDKQE